MLTAIQGIYRDGKIQLTEVQSNESLVSRSRVPKIGENTGTGNFIQGEDVRSTLQD